MAFKPDIVFHRVEPTPEQAAYHEKRWKKLLKKLTPEEAPLVVANATGRSCLMAKKMKSGHVPFNHQFFDPKPMQARQFVWMYSRETWGIPKVDVNGNVAEMHQVCGKKHCLEPLHLRLATKSDGIYNAKLLASGVAPNSSPAPSAARPPSPTISTPPICTLKQKWDTAEWRAARDFLTVNSSTPGTVGDAAFTAPCRRWDGPKMRVGNAQYGQAVLGGILCEAHVLSWLIEHPERPDDEHFFIHHRCENTLCIEPTHLVACETVPKPVTAEGEDKKQGRKNSGGRFMTAEEVIAIRLFYYRNFSNNQFLRKLGVKYDVSDGCISKIVGWKTWKNVTNDEVEQAYREFVMYGSKNKKVHDDVIREIRQAEHDPAELNRLRKLHGYEPWQIRNILSREAHPDVPDIAPPFDDPRVKLRLQEEKKVSQRQHARLSHVYDCIFGKMEQLSPAVKKRRKE
jgi:hypothetical protein